MKNKLSLADENGYSDNSELYKALVNIVESAENYEVISKNLYNYFKENVEKVEELNENKTKFNLEDYKKIMMNLIKFPCKFSHANYLSNIFLEIVEFEKHANECINKNILDCSMIKKYLDYCLKIRIDLGSVYSQLKSQYIQALWMSEVNKTISTPKSLTLDKVRNLLVSATSFSSSNSIIVKKIINLQELYCIAKIWDKKAEIYIANKYV